MAVICGIPSELITALLRKMRPKSSVSGNHILLQGQKHAGRIHQVDRGNTIFHGNGLCAQHLFRGHGEKGAGLYGGVVGHDQAQSPAYFSQSRYDARSGRAAIFRIHATRRPQPQFQEFRALIEQEHEPLSRRQPPFAVLRLGGLRATAMPHRLFLGAHLAQQSRQRRAVRLHARIFGIECRSEAII